MSKLTLKRVHEIIREEISNIEKINDNDMIATVVNTSVDLLKALDKFNNKASESQKAAISSTIDQLKKQLLNMRDSASSYVTVKQTGPKKVVFKKSTEDSSLSD